MISIIIPILNEERILPELLRRISAILDTLGDPAEIIFVDDGSTDGSLRLIADAQKRDRRVKAISFSRNFGHQVAISAGIDHADGDGIIIMDGDLQDPPEILPSFIAKWREGYDVVYAVRTKRKEGLLKRAAYAVFYRIMRRLAYVDIPLDSGDFCLMSRRVADTLRSLPERNRFVRGLRSWAGFRQVGLTYERERRFAGPPKYTLGKLFRLAYDGIFSFSTVPLRVAVYTGFFLSIAAFLGALWVLYQKIFLGIALVGWASTMVTLMFIAGAILSTLGVIGEYVGRIYEEVKNRPLYVVQEKIGFAKTRPRRQSRTDR